MAKAKQAESHDESIGAKPKVTKGKKPQVAIAAGHNSGVNPQLVEIFTLDAEYQDKIKELNKARRDLRNRAKTEFNVLSSVYQHQVKLRKMDRDVRIQFESGTHDLQNMLGYQASLDLAPGTVPRTEEEYLDPSAVAAGKLINKHH
jgi:hypothetical protein